jgi:hypothetical protein
MPTQNTRIIGSELEPSHVGRTVAVAVGTHSRVTGTLQAYLTLFDPMEYVLVIGGERYTVPPEGFLLVGRPVNYRTR